MFEAYYATLLEELAARGIDRAALPAPPPTGVTAQDLAVALERALALTGDPALGIAFGMRLNLASHGILGYALMSSRNGDQLLALLTRYAALAVPSLSLQRVLAGERLLLTCHVSDGPLPAGFLRDLVLTTLVSGARALFNRRIPGAEVWFECAAPPYARSYDALGVPVRFSRPHSALVCSREFLDMPLASANPVMAEIGARQCEDLLAGMQRRAGTVERVRRFLVQAHGSFPDQADVAARLNVSERTLRRRLEGEGTTFRAILDEVKFELAKRYLSAPELRIGQIAELLGYDDPANFRRAFRRWSGSSAQAWRAATEAGRR